MSDNLYIDVQVPVVYNEKTAEHEAKCPECEMVIYSISEYVREAIGRDLPVFVPHTCALPQLPADYGNPSHYDDGTPRYMN